MSRTLDISDHPRKLTSMMTKPLVSVIMTAYNREKYIGEAIESVLASTFSNFELIICDDCSKDRTFEIAGEYAARDSRIRLVKNEYNLGDYPNRNKASSYATGVYIKYLDSDDLLYTYSLGSYVNFMEMHHDVALGISYGGGFTTQPFPIILDPSRSIRHHFFTKHFLNCAPSGTIYRRDIFEAAGRFKAKTTIDDLRLALKIATTHNVMLLPPCLFFWREHGDQEISISTKNNVFDRLHRELVEKEVNDVPGTVLNIREKLKLIRHYRKVERISSRRRYFQRLLKLKF